MNAKNPLQNQDFIVLVLAVQLGFVSADKVMALASAWMTDPSTSLSRRMQDEGLLSREKRIMLQKLADESISAHGGNASLVLASMGAEKIINETFSGSVVIEPDGRLVTSPRSEEPATREDKIQSVDESISDVFEITPMAKDRYEFGQEHARGGQARILLTRDKHIGRQIAWKELLQKHTATKTFRGTSSERLSSKEARFLREARITGQLEHPNIIPVYELGYRDDGTIYYTMRMVRGMTLAHALKECETLSDRLLLLQHFADMCHAIAFAHNRAVIHRDIKPQNVMVGEFGETVMLDWGLAKVSGKKDLGIGELEQQVQFLQKGSQTATIEGSALGTPAYMSHEQAEGLIDEIDERSDVWGLGAVLYEILTGRAPFTGESPYEIIGKVMKDPVCPVQDISPHAPPELVAIAECALSRDKRQRYENASKLSEDLTAFMSGARVGVYEYSSWELFKRFAAKNRAALLAASIVLMIVLVSLVVVSFSYKRESLSRRQEHIQGLLANQHLSQAYSMEAKRLLRNKMPLSASIFTAASLVFNPANPNGEFYDKQFTKDHPKALSIKAETDSQLYKSRFRFIDSMVWKERLDSPVFCMSVSPDGKLIALGDYKGRITLLDTKTGEKKYEILAHSESIMGIAFDHSGKKIVTGSTDQTVKIWKVGDKKALVVMGTDSPVMAVAISPDDTKIAAGMSNGFIFAWNSDGDPLFKLGPHSGKARGLAFSPDSSMLACASWDKTASLWDISKRRKLQLLKGHGDALYSVAFSADGNNLATSSYDRSVRIWNTQDGHLLRVLPNHTDAVETLAYSPDAKTLATGTNDGIVHLWDLENRRLKIAFVAHQGIVSSIGYTPDGKYLATASYEKTVKLWKVRATDGLRRFFHNDWIYGIDYSPDGKLLVTGVWDGSINLWSVDSKKLLWSNKKYKDPLFTCIFSPDATMIACGGTSGKIRILDSKTGNLIREIKGHQDRVGDMDFSPDGHILASASHDKTVRLWNVTTGKCEKVLGDYLDRAFNVRYSANGKYLATSANNFVFIYDANDLHLITKLFEHTDWVSGIDFSPDGRLFASCGKDKSIIIWKVGSWKKIKTLRGHTIWVNKVVFSPDSKLLASAGDDELVIVWDLESFAPILKLRTDGSAMRSVFDPRGKTIAVEDHDQVVFYPLELRDRKRNPTILLKEAEKRAGLKLKSFELQTN